MFHVLETRLLEAPRHIAVDSPKHCKGCKKNMNFEKLHAISISFFGFCNPYTVLELFDMTQKLVFGVKTL